MNNNKDKRKGRVGRVGNTGDYINLEVKYEGGGSAELDGNIIMDKDIINEICKILDDEYSNVVEFEQYESVMKAIPAILCTNDLGMLLSARNNFTSSIKHLYTNILINLLGELPLRILHEMASYESRPWYD
jgi:hypothetical protein